MEDKNVALGWIINKAKPLIPGVLIISIIAVLSSVTSVLTALCSKEVVDSAVSLDYSLLINYAILLGCLILAELLFSFLYMKISANIIAKHTLSMQTDIFKKVMGMEYKNKAAFHTGELINRITTDSNSVICGIVGIIPSVAAFLSGILSAFTAIYKIAPAFALLCAVFGVVIGFGAAFWGKRLKKFTLECKRRIDRVTSFMMECIQNILVIKTFSNENNVVGYGQKLQDETYKSLKKRNSNSILASMASDITFTLGYFFALGWGAFGVYFGTFTYGTLMAMVQLVGKIQSPFKGIASVIPQFYQMLASAERLMDVVKFAKEEETGEKINDFKELLFNDVTFGYDDMPVIKNINLKINKGDFILISGSSGIGKSTLLKLLLNIYTPSEGEILVNSDGHTLKPVKVCRRGLFAYVPQDNMILSGTVKENVLFFSSDVNEENIIKALRTAELWDDIKKLPNGLDTPLGENGIGLSQGQAQRLAVARALYYNAPVLLLDESTSALDRETEEKMLSNIKALKDKTCILISHKNLDDKYINKKITIEDGKIRCSQF